MSLHAAVFAVVLCLVLSLAGCGKPPAKTEEIRPVRTVVVSAADSDISNTYAGEVRPRYESELGFRVSGKVLDRPVSVGDAVKTGQLLARLDPKDLTLTEDSARAQVAVLDAQLAVAKSDYERNKKLFDEGVIGAAGIDRYQATYQAAQAQLRAARAQLRSSSNQAGYAELRADYDGVITAVLAEPGQVVAAGQTVLRLARSGETEVAISVPENQIGHIHAGLPVQVSLWAESGTRIAGTIRELASSADPATRTYALRISVPRPPAEMKLGMTASVRIPVSGVPKLIHIPLGALIEQHAKKGVWVFNPSSKTVEFHPVSIAGIDGNEILVAAGLEDGDIVVTAGAPLLLPGQKVTLLHDTAASY